MASVFEDIFDEFELTFQTEGSYAKNPDTLKFDQSAPIPVTLRCWLKQTRNPAVQRAVETVLESPGADSIQVALTGRLIDPVLMPSSVKPRMECPLTLLGKEGRFILAPSTPSLLDEVDQELGQRIQGLWEGH